MPHAGLDISDDAIRCIEYHRRHHGLVISKYGNQPLPPGMIVDGDIKDDKAFSAILTTFAEKYSLSNVKVSLSEEKAYLFQTDVPSDNFSSIAQNIEFKLEQNVPLAAPDALFQFDLMPEAVTGGLLRASVSVVPRVYVENYVSILKGSKLCPTAFEVAPKSIVAACIPSHSADTNLIVHVMKKKTGLYIVSENVVCFTSTISWGSDDLQPAEKGDTLSHPLAKEINRVYTFWLTRPDVHTKISEIVVVGSRADECELLIRDEGVDALSRSVVPDVWRNTFSIDQYIPPISKTDSLEFAIAAGLAL